MACPMTFGSKDIAIIPITWYCQTAPHTNIVSRREKKKRERRRGEKKKRRRNNKIN